MFSKFFNKTSKDTMNTSDDGKVRTSTDMASKRFSSADVVFGLGILMIVLGAVYALSNMRKETVNKVSDSPFKMEDVNSTPPLPYEAFGKTEVPWHEKTNNPLVQNVRGKHNVPTKNELDKNMHTPPFENHTQKKEPWHVQNRHEESSAGNIQVFENKKHEKALKEKKIQEITTQHLEEVAPSYVCNILPLFKNLVGQEILYYVRKKEKDIMKYVPAYLLNSWDEKGIVIKKKFIVTGIDIDHEMVAIDTNKWIPALKFSSCILVGGTE